MIPFFTGLPIAGAGPKSETAGIGGIASESTSCSATEMNLFGGRFVPHVNVIVFVSPGPAEKLRSSTHNTAGARIAREKTLASEDSFTVTRTQIDAGTLVKLTALSWNTGVSPAVGILPSAVARVSSTPWEERSFGFCI